MSYCPNPNCVQPLNPSDEEFCLSCGTDLIVGDRYRILKPISAGGFGMTFLAVDEGWDSPGDSASEAPGPERALCVLKRFALRVQNSSYAEKAAQLFQAEAARLRELADQPQIPLWLDQFDHDGDQYLVQEFIEGQTLEDVLTEQGPFSETQIRTVLHQLLPIVQVIHQQQIIHRDIKPANIIRSEGDRLVLVDFGASKYATNTVLARTGTMIGSAGYAAPEQTLGKATFASDLYSLGVTCIHLLTGVHPFDLYSVSEDRWVWRDFLSQPVGDRLASILDKMLHRPLSQRYASAAAILHDLHDRGTEGNCSVAPATPTWQGSPSSPPPTVQSIPEVGPMPRRATSPPTLYALDQTLLGHETTVTVLALSACQTWIASASRDSRICLWNGRTGELVHRFEWRFPKGRQGRGRSVSLKPVEAIASLAITPDARSLLMSGSDGAVKVWDLEQKTLKQTWSVEGWGITATALSSDGELLALGSGDGTIRIWDLVEQTRIATIHRHRDRITALTFTHDGEWLVSSSLDRTIRLWDVGAIWEAGTCALLNTMRSGDRVTTLAFSPDEEMVVSAGTAGELTLWSVATGELLKTIPAHRAAITALATSLKGRWLASGSDDSSIKLWAWGSSPALEYVEQLPSSWAVKALTFSADQHVLISGGSDGTLQIWRKR